MCNIFWHKAFHLCCVELSVKIVPEIADFLKIEKKCLKLNQELE
jgi:hypothetical protein